MQGDCHPDFPGASYARGPTDKNDAMFPFERKMADAIEARCGGKATSPVGPSQEMSDKKPSCPGMP